MKKRSSFSDDRKVVGKGGFFIWKWFGKQYFSAALKIAPGYGNMDSEKQLKEDKTEDE